MVDFHDLEQFALRLLWDARTDKPTRIARQWRKQLRYVFVDEYQDINAAQDKIIEALSREGALGNRFLVGDVKQSIYRFRLANPYIFQGYVDTWHDSQARSSPWWTISAAARASWLHQLAFRPADAPRAGRRGL